MARTRVTESARARQARRDKEAERRRGLYLTRQNFLDSQGPLVKEIGAREITLIMLMRRVDLASLARSESWPQPISAAVRRLMLGNGQPTEADLAEDRIHETIAACAAIVRASIIVPPPEFLTGAIEIGDITAAMCKPFFVEADPDDDQVILRVMGDAEAAAMSDDDRSAAAASGYLHPRDLMYIAEMAYEWGPGAAGLTFRQARAAVDAVPAVEATADEAA